MRPCSESMIPPVLSHTIRPDFMFIGEVDLRGVERKRRNRAPGRERRSIGTAVTTSFAGIVAAQGARRRFQERVTELRNAALGDPVPSVRH